MGQRAASADRRGRLTCGTCGLGEPEVDFRPKNRRTCRPCERARHRARHQANLLREKAVQRAWRERNAASEVERVEAWRRAHPERARDTARVVKARRRARMRDIEVECVSRAAVFERDEGLCGICGAAVDPACWDLDHVTPISRGGSHTMANVQVSHPICNRRKGAR